MEINIEYKNKYLKYKKKYIDLQREFQKGGAQEERKRTKLSVFFQQVPPFIKIFENIRLDYLDPEINMTDLKEKYVNSLNREDKPNTENIVLINSKGEQLTNELKLKILATDENYRLYNNRNINLYVKLRSDGKAAADKAAAEKAAELPIIKVSRNPVDIFITGYKNFNTTFDLKRNIGELKLFLKKKHNINDEYDLTITGTSIDKLYDYNDLEDVLSETPEELKQLKEGIHLTMKVK